MTTTPETRLIGISDGEQLYFAMSENWVIFTHDDFVGIHHGGGGMFMHAGIIYCAQNRHSIGEILRRLILIWEVLEPEEMIYKLEFLRKLLLFYLNQKKRYLLVQDATRSLLNSRGTLMHPGATPVFHLD